jgi:hypothetical protein
MKSIALAILIFAATLSFAQTSTINCGDPDVNFELNEANGQVIRHITIHGSENHTYDYTFDATFTHDTIVWSVEGTAPPGTTTITINRLTGEMVTSFPYRSIKNNQVYQKTERTQCSMAATQQQF